MHYNQSIMRVAAKVPGRAVIVFGVGFVGATSGRVADLGIAGRGAVAWPWKG